MEATDTRLSDSPQEFYREIAAEQEAEALHEIADWNQVGRAFIRASKGDRSEAERVFELTLDRIFDSGALSMRAYRGILRAIRDGR